MKASILSSLERFTSCTDVQIIEHSETNLLITLNDESEYPRAIQVRNFDGEFLITDTYSNSESYRHEAEGVQDLTETLVSLVVC